jgi:ferredoxin-like protein FixX
MSLETLAPITVNVDEYLALNKYGVDENQAHIVLVDDPSDEEFLKLVRVCPAALYKIDEKGAQSFDYAGCLECGTCRIICGDTIIKQWQNPSATMGVEYRYG